MPRRFLLLLVLTACRGKHGDAYKVAELTAHGARTCASMKDGSVRCWGRDDGRAEMRPTLVPGMKDAAAVCASDRFVCALTRTGSVACTGGWAPSQGASSIACSADKLCVIAGGHVQCGALGTALVEIPSTGGATGIAMGGGTACAVFPDGTAKCWGSGTRGQLGSGRYEDASAPATVQAINIASIAVGEEHTCAVLRDETAVCFGANDDGQLGTGDLEQSAVPRVVKGIDIAKQIACGAHHTCARMGDSTVHCWGRNDAHQSSVEPAAHVLEQKLFPGLYEAESVALGNDFTCVRMKDDWVRCFGVNDWGQLADGTTEIRNVPTPIRYE